MQENDNDDDTIGLSLTALTIRGCRRFNSVVEVFDIVVVNVLLLFFWPIFNNNIDIDIVIVIVIVVVVLK